MAYSPIALIMPQYDRTNLKNYWLKAYQQGTTTPLSMATDVTGGTLLAKCEIDIQGFPVTALGARFIPFLNADYDLWLFPTEAEADANDTTDAIQVADNLNTDALRTDLASVAGGEGASLVSIQDAGVRFTSTNVEGALQETATTAELASTTNGFGASLVAIEDAAATFTATDVEGALAEIVTEKTAVADLASTANGEGASLVGLEDAAGNFTATTVEAALAELPPPLSAVTDFTVSSVVYIDDDGDSQGGSSFDIDAVIGAAWESIGPTGSGATNIWTTLDSLPSTAKWVELGFYVSSNRLGADTYSQVFGRKTGSAATANLQTQCASADINIGGATATTIVVYSTKKVPLDGSLRFDLYLAQRAGTTTAASAHLVAFGI